MTAFHLIYVVLMVVLIVGVDILFFRSPARFRQRLIANAGIVLVAVLLYLLFARPR